MSFWIKIFPWLKKEPTIKPKSEEERLNECFDTIRKPEYVEPSQPWPHSQKEEDDRLKEIRERLHIDDIEKRSRLYGAFPNPPSPPPPRRVPAMGKTEHKEMRSLSRGTETFRYSHTHSGIEDVITGAAVGATVGAIVASAFESDNSTPDHDEPSCFDGGDSGGGGASGDFE